MSQIRVTRTYYYRFQHNGLPLAHQFLILAEKVVRRAEAEQIKVLTVDTVARRGERLIIIITGTAAVVECGECGKAMRPSHARKPAGQTLKVQSVHYPMLCTACARIADMRRTALSNYKAGSYDL